LNGSLRRYLAAIGLVGIVAGCGPSDRGAEAKGPVTGPNRRIDSKRFENEDYKKMLGKDGKPAWRPGQLPKK
jgi:hypothetical protein